jgi:hypothetical protein
VLILLLSLIQGVFAQNVTEEMKERANELFEKEQYVEATPLYLQILSLEPKNADWNFKYGACLLYNSGEKNDAIRYLKYGVNTEGTDERVFYFYGRALHLDYQFDQAKKFYIKYQSKREKPDKRYPVEREIRMCENGKRLLTTITDIIVTDKKQIAKANFFEIYSDSKTIGGSIIVNADFQSKLDRKKGHVPTVHFPPNAKMIFYSSYGEDESTGKDIYMRIRLPDGTWGEPQLARGNVNSNEDEDYPFLHASGKFLYFSSKGHNSMGGYDIFMCRWDPNTNSFGPPENVDFAISSPDDDLFYVVDSTFSNAYFASSRSSEQDKLHVYKVKVVRVPIQEVIVMGNFTSDIHPEDQKITLQLLKHSNGEELTKMPVTAAKGGRYSYVFPQGGKYDYVVDVEGSNAQYKFTIELPFLDEFRPLKQEIIHTTENGNEIIRIVNRFDERVEGAEALIAEVIRKKSELDVNVNQFDLEAIESRQKTDEILADLGFDNMSLREVSAQLNSLNSQLAESEELAKRLEANIASELIAKADRVKELNSMEQELRQSADKSSDPVVRHKLITEAQGKQQEKELLLQQIAGLEQVMADITSFEESIKDNNDIASILKEFDALREGNEAEALDVLVSGKETINNTKQVGPNTLREKYIAETIERRQNVRKLQEKRNEYQTTTQKVNDRIQNLQRERETAKRREQERIDEEIANLKEELAVLENEVDRLTTSIQQEEQQLDEAEDRLASYQNAEATEDYEAFDSALIEEVTNEMNSIVTEEAFDYNSALTALENEHPEVADSGTSTSSLEELQAKYQEERDNIVNNDALSPQDQNAALIANNEEAQRSIDKRLKTVEQQLKQNDSETLKETAAALKEQQRILERERDELDAEALALNEESTDVALSKEDVFKEILPDWQEKLDEIASSPSLNEEEALAARKDLYEEAEEELKSSLQNLETELKERPNDEALQARKELVSILLNENTSSQEELSVQIASLQESVETKTPTEFITQVDAQYESRLNEIDSSDASIEEKEREKLELNNKLLEQLEKEKVKTEKALARNEDNMLLLSQKESVDQAIGIVESRIAESNQTLIALEQGSVAAVSEEDVLAEIAPNLESDRNAIVTSEQSEIQKLEALLALEEKTRDNLEKAKKKWQKKADRDPEDVESKNQLKAHMASINNREAEITRLQSDLAVVRESQNVATVDAATMLSEVVPDLDDQLNAIEQSNDSPSAKARRKAQVTAGVLETLREEEERLQKDLQKDKANTDLSAKVSAIQLALEEQQNLLSTYEKKAVEELLESEKRSLIAQVSSSYADDISSLSKAEQIEQENELQDALRKNIETNRKRLERSYDAEVAIEKLTYELLLKESESRVSEIENGSTTNEADEFVAMLRETAGANVADALKEERKDVEGLQEQGLALEAYESYLEEQIDIQEQTIAMDPSIENKETLRWLLDEKDRVQKKRRSVRVSIGALEQVAENTSQNESEEIVTLKEKEDKIRAAQSDENLSSSEQKSLKRELRDIQEKRYAIENESIELALNEEKEEAQTLQQELSERNATSDEVIQRTLNRADAEQKAIESIEENARNADSEAERNYLMQQAVQRQEALNREMNDALVNSELNALESEYDISTSSRADLEKQKRSFTVKIGEVTREIQQVDEAIEGAKKKERPELETKKKVLQERKLQLEAQLKRIDDQLRETSEPVSAVSSRALETEIGFNEERELAASVEYEIYQKAATEALTVANEILNLEEELKVKRNVLQRAVRDKASEDETRRIAVEIQALETQLERKQIELTQKKFTADQTLPENTETAMKMQNLVARGIQPLKLTAAATAVIAMPTSGFAIDTTSDRPNSGVVEIPVGVKNPEGLVYRVQVGAFARPLRSDVFSEFNPVSGEKIEGTNITRYMAGYFASSERVVEARQQIRALGYSDAFVVAYCNGERITLGEARRREAAGICVPKRVEEIAIEVAENTAKTLNIPLESELKELPEWSYADAPGAADADPIENMKGLFFTVQIGVFNRPVTSAELQNMPSISSFRLPNGLIRYNTGMFDSAEEALPRQEFARKSGIQGAFIVAYYKGERISIGNARRLLLEYGESVLQTRIKTEKTELAGDNGPVRSDSVRTDVIEIAPLEEWEKRVQIVTEATFDEFPRDVLNRYNAEGSFYFDENDKRVKSTVYKNEDYLPNLFNFSDDIDTIYLDEGLLEDQQTDIIHFVFTDSLVPGSFMDWMLRCNYRREINRTYKGTEVRIFGVPEGKIEGILERIRVFGVEPERIQETTEE